LPDLSDLNLPQSSYSRSPFREMRTSGKRAPNLKWDGDEECAHGDESSELSEDEIVLSELCSLEPLSLSRTTSAPLELNTESSSSQGLFPRTQSARLSLSERVQPASLPPDFLERVSLHSPLQMPSSPCAPPLTNRQLVRMIPPPIMIPPPVPENRPMYVARRNPGAQALRLVNETCFALPREESRGTVLSLLSASSLEPPEQTKKQRRNEEIAYPG